MHDPDREQHRFLVADAPLRLEISQENGGFRGYLATVKVPAPMLACGGVDLHDERRGGDL